MKNICLLFSTLCLFTGLGSNVLFAADGGRTNAPAGATIKLQIERKEITKEEAETYRTSGESVKLGVYAILSPEWASELNSKVGFSSSNISWAFYETEAFSHTEYSTDPSHYLQNPSDYIKICAMPGRAGEPADACYLQTSGSWYGTKQWQNFGWPTFAWGSGFNGGEIYTDQSYAQQEDGSYKIKIFEIQFKLNPTNTNFRSLPVGFLDDILSGKLDGSNANCQINPENTQTSKLYWPKNGANDQDCSACTTCQYCQDWTDLKNTSYFEFIPGGLFIKTGPEVEGFEPYFSA